MEDYIDRKAAVEVLCEACGNVGCENEAYQRCPFYIRMHAIPAADVPPVVHGRWLVFHEFDSCQLLQCDKCGAMIWNHEKETPNFCYKCGARMDGDIHG